MKKSFATLLTVVILLSALALPVSALVSDSAYDYICEALYRGDELYMTRGAERHWWLTGFKLFDMVTPSELTLHASFFMEDVGMADALEDALLDLGFIEGVNYQRLGLTMTIIWR